MKFKDLVVCYGIFKETVSERVGGGSWMSRGPRSRKRDEWTEETLLEQESRQKAKRGGGPTEVGRGVLVRGCLSHQAQESGYIFPKEPSHLPKIPPLWMEPE